MKREAWIDSCRFFAIFVVIVTHFLADLLPGALLLWERMPSWLLLGGLTGKFSVAFFFVLLGYFASAPKRLALGDFARYALRRYIQFAFFVLVTEAVYLPGCRVVSRLFHAPDAAAAQVLSDGWYYNLIYLLRDSLLFECRYNSALWCMRQLFLASLLCRLLGGLSDRLSPALQLTLTALAGGLLMLVSPRFCVWLAVALLGVMLRCLQVILIRPLSPPVCALLFLAAVSCIKAPLEEGLLLYLLEGLGAFLLLLVLFHTAFARRLLSRGPFPRLGRDSMGLFVVHTPVFSLCACSVYAFLFDRLPLAAALAISFAAGMALSLFAARLLHRAYALLQRRMSRQPVGV